jgi:hypothetical protein
MHVKAGLTRVTAETGAVTLIQRFGSAHCFWTAYTSRLTMARFSAG